MACAAGDLTDRATVRDSAGVAIVASATGAWTIETAWHLADTPSVVIGSEADSMTQFGRVRAVTRLSSGRIVVAEGSTDQLRYFDPRGGFERTVGRHGAGPGEFDFVDWIGALPGDSLLVLDANNYRFALFDSAGTLVSSTPVPGQRVEFRAVLDDGTLLSSRLATTDGPVVLGLRTFTTVWTRVGRDLRILDTLGTGPAGDGYVFECGQPNGEQGICNWDPFFARIESFAAWNDRLFVGDGGRYEITVIDTAGRRFRSIRRAVEPRRVTAEALASQREQRLAFYLDEDRRRAAERTYTEIPVPETMPAYSRLIADREGNLWVEEYRVTTSDPLQWTVFDTAGRMLGTLNVPTSLSIAEIHGDAVIGVARDSLGVEQIRAYPIRKPGRR
jgi:hypothetical protein